MKSVGFLKTLGSVVAMVVACNVYAQASDATATGTTAAPAASAKASKKANSQLGRKVRAAISKTQGVDVSNISVRARGGAVTLTGSVPDQGQIDAAGEAAKGVAGVTSVSNKLSVMQQ
ncbi:BON domain-containing protein [Paraburkholderia sp. SIMBA_055]|jgi:hyperosmotically inducible periplasmic protein|uniref:Transport-associated n=2 Tax=Paraburkholderia graminis TaxID=60548 RepID=B1FW84_PARG4|nr:MULTISPECIES: BON domain-containing protein [Paraburkholderia]ALE53782.1 phospholipid-binding protein [Burkholderia sp. HB1]AXF06974.1 BON domain-containing protein [Paraburkholderia graminis]EDT11660.1 transport-associated [Paraburkholderia graminis C4D1M]MDQ0621827.1 hyperosmotically inducible protein [Paraburkholderia graminis]MDR6201484.1 hyperosmotically inducible protein [Paraburkholderia graminis]